LHKYKNLLNAMAALFFSNHSMENLGGLFNHWRELAAEKRKQRKEN